MFFVYCEPAKLYFLKFFYKTKISTILTFKKFNLSYIAKHLWYKALIQLHSSSAARYVDSDVK
jgi:hypothetical protein